MVHRQFHLRHGSDVFPIDYDTSDGLDVLRFQIFSLTSVLPDNQKIVVEDGGLVLGEADDLAAISDGLRLVSMEDGEREEVKPVEMSDEDLARMLQAEEDEISMQILQAEDGGREFEHRVRPMMSQVLMYEDPVRQEAARRTVPMDEIEEKALVWLAKEGTFNPSEDEKDYAFLLQLLFWFKQSFRWVNAPSCDGCGGDTIFSGMGNAIPVEIHYGCSRVELYRCKKCSKTTRFPRYNDPLKLLETRRGRCGEWANCFTLYCRAFGYESRLILDFTDHLWTECFSSLLGRWMHLDPCEGIYDKPLLYEKGWNKNLSYVIAISKDGTCDVTRRYTRKWHEVLSRRNITTEISVKAVLSNLTRERRNGYSSEILSVLESRDKMEENELDNVDNQCETSLTLPGRQSGSIEWRMSRLEIGAGDEKSLSHTSCPIRTCVDDHVSIIYSSLSDLLCHFLSSGLEKTEVVIIFETLKQLLTDLKFSSFKVRKGFVDLGSIRSQSFKQSLPAIVEFLSAVSLRREANVDEKICISLAGSPVQTSISLPVALDGLNEIIFSLDDINRFDQCFLSNFSRFNRISSGSVLASGEEIPLGIATSAFDGGSTSKWEEPNGAKGCWLVYKVKDGQAHTLKAYELMSANDAPERDPMNWILEGSEDEGCSWNIIDQQTSQIFDERFQRKRFEVESKLMLNALRFKFLAVRDPKATSRFQIGSIDLYAAKI